jgi:hypothetical protein
MRAFADELREQMQHRLSDDYIAAAQYALDHGDYQTFAAISLFMGIKLEELQHGNAADD